MKKILILTLALLTAFSFSACTLINSLTQKAVREESPDATTGEHLTKLYEGKFSIDGVEYDYSKTTVDDLLKDGWAIAPIDKSDPNTFYGEINLVKGDKSFFVQNTYSETIEEGNNTLPIFSFTERIENYSQDYKPVFKLPGNITLMDNYEKISAAYGKPAEYSGSPNSASIIYGLNDGTYIYFSSSEFLDEATNFTNTYRALTIQASTAHADNFIMDDEVINVNDESPLVDSSINDSPNIDDSPVSTAEETTEGVGGLDMTSPNIDEAPSITEELSDSSHPMVINDNPVEGA